MKQEVKIGQTDYTVCVLIRDTAGAPKTDLAWNTAGLDFCYTRVETDNDVVLTDGAPASIAALTSAHLDWGFLAVEATKAPGVYRLDLPDGVFATGAWSAVVSIICSGTIDPTHLEFVLVPSAPVDGVNVKQVGGSNVPVTTATLISDALTDTAVASAVMTTTVADSVPADGTRPSLAQGIYMLVQRMLESSVSGTTLTVKKPDGTTTLLTCTLSDATNPTSVTRAT